MCLFLEWMRFMGMMPPPAPGNGLCWGSTSGQPLSGALVCANHVFMCQGAPWRWGHCRRSRSGSGQGLLFSIFFERVGGDRGGVG